MEKAFKRMNFRIPNVLKNITEDKNSPKVFLEEIGENRYKK